MTLYELKEFLAGYPDDTEIYIQIDIFSDYGHLSVLEVCYDLDPINEKQPSSIVLVPKILT